MDEKRRIELIREGNQFFNEAKQTGEEEKLKKALYNFTITSYQDGLFRIADYLFYEKKRPLFAFPIYKKINTKKAKKRINEIFIRFVKAFRVLAKDDENSNIKQE